jgi:hypothetical protein
LLVDELRLAHDPVEVAVCGDEGEEGLEAGALDRLSLK